MAYGSATNLYGVSKYIVDTNAGSTQYTTIQAALDDANAAGGNSLVYVRTGTYVESLVLYDTIGIQGDTNDLVTIAGVHTPPASGTCSIANVTLSSATHIFSSAVAGTADITLRNCILFCTNGYAFNLENWNAGFEVFDCEDRSTDNHGVNNTAASSLTVRDSSFGISSTTMTLSGPVKIYGSIISCPMTVTGSSEILIDNGSTLYDTINISDTVVLDVRNSSLATGADSAIITNSSGNVTLSNITIDSTNANVIDGTGTVIFGEVTFLESSAINITVVQNWGTYGTQVSTGSLSLPSCDSSIPQGIVLFGGLRGLTVDVSANMTYLGIGSGSTNSAGGINNCGFGTNSLGSVLGASSCCAFGSSSLASIVSASNNTAFGHASLANLSTGQRNIALGFTAGNGYNSSENSNIVIGANGTTGESHVIRLGTQGSSSGQQNKFYAAGIRGTNITGGYPVYADSTGALGATILPAFRAYNNAGASAVTGDGTVWTIVYDTSVVNNGTCFDTSTYIFTASLTGFYSFSGAVQINSVAVGNTNVYVYIVATGGTYYCGNINPNAVSVSGTMIVPFHIVIPMTATDTAIFNLRVDGNATANIGINGGDGYSWCSGYMITQQ
jgi:hypothetical protein